MMCGGRIIILGDSGEKARVEDMTGGHIFGGGTVHDLGSDAEQVDLDEGKDDDRRDLCFTGSFKQTANAGKKLRYATSERQMRSIPVFTFSTVESPPPVTARTPACRAPCHGHASAQGAEKNGFAACTMPPGEEMRISTRR